MTFWLEYLIFPRRRKLIRGYRLLWRVWSRVNTLPLGERAPILEQLATWEALDLLRKCRNAIMRELQEERRKGK